MTADITSDDTDVTEFTFCYQRNRNIFLSNASASEPFIISQHKQAQIQESKNERKKGFAAEFSNQHTFENR